MYTYSHHPVTVSYVRQWYRIILSLPGGGQRGLFLYSLSELPEIQGGEIHLTSGLPSFKEEIHITSGLPFLINQSCYVVLYILRNSVLAMVSYNNTS